MKGLTPSGVELEVMGLVSFDFTDEQRDNPDYYLMRFLEMIKQVVLTRLDSDFVQALLNCCLKVNYETLIANDNLMEKVRDI
jgi:hypothetical protein